MVRKLKANCAFKLLILEERGNRDVQNMRKTGGNTELMTLVLTEGEEGCCKYLDTGGKREGSYYMPLYLHSLSIWLQLQRSAEGVLYLTQPQAHFVSLDRPWLRQPNIPKLSLENKLCRKTKKRSFVATKWIFFFFFPQQMCKFRHIKNQTTIRAVNTYTLQWEC